MSYPGLGSSPMLLRRVEHALRLLRHARERKSLITGFAALYSSRDPLAMAAMNKGKFTVEVA